MKQIVISALIVVLYITKPALAFGQFCSSVSNPCDSTTECCVVQQQWNGQFSTMGMCMPRPTGLQPCLTHNTVVGQSNVYQIVCPCAAGYTCKECPIPTYEPPTLKPFTVPTIKPWTWTWTPPTFRTHTWNPPTRTWTVPTFTWNPLTRTFAPPTFTVPTVRPITRTFKPITWTPPTWTPPTWTPPTPRTHTWNPPTATWTVPTFTWNPPTRTYNPPTFTVPTFKPLTRTFNPPTFTFKPPTMTFKPFTIPVPPAYCPTIPGPFNFMKALGVAKLVPPPMNSIEMCISN